MTEATALTPDELQELDDLLDDLRQRAEEIPQWEFCDGFLTALVCTRRRIPASDYLPMLPGDGATFDIAEGSPLPLLPAFREAAQQARFMELWQRRWNEVDHQLDQPVETLEAPGEWMHTPKGSVHAFSNPHQGTAKAPSSLPLASVRNTFWMYKVS